MRRFRLTSKRASLRSSGLRNPIAQPFSFGLKKTKQRAASRKKSAVRRERASKLFRARSLRTDFSPRLLPLSVQMRRRPRTRVHPRAHRAFRALRSFRQSLKRQACSFAPKTKQCSRSQRRTRKRRNGACSPAFFARIPPSFSASRGTPSAFMTAGFSRRRMHFPIARNRPTAANISA